MQRKSFSDMECPIARSLEQMGDGWTQLLIRNALLGARRFQDFEAALAIPPTTLSRRLDGLVTHGLLVRHTYAERPRREEYHLTKKGLDFAPVLLALSAWGNRWLAPSGSLIDCADPATGRRVDPVVVDRRTRRELAAGKVALRAGRGASPTLQKALKKPVLFGPSPGSVRSQPLTGVDL